MMRPIRFVLFAVVLLAAASNAALAVERFPPPEFTDHALPTTQFAPARPAFIQYVDVALLAGGLALASYLALARRSRRGLFVLSIAALAWFGFVRHGCVCSIGAIQNVALAAGNANYTVPWVVVAFFVLPLVFTLFFGRTFCAAVCPLGAAQELVAVRPIRVPRWLEHALGLLPHVYLGLGVALAAVGTAFLICRYDPFVGFFRLGATSAMLIFGGCVLAIGVFVGRPYCRFLCPYGVVLGWLSRLSKWRVRITPDQCIGCRLCEDVCPYGAIEPPTSALSPAARPAVRGWFVFFLVLLPVLIAAGAVLGSHLAVPLSRLDPAVELAEQVWAEDHGLTHATTDASDAFRNTQRPPEELYRAAQSQRVKLAWAGMGFGAWVGLVVGMKFIMLARYPRQTDYEPNPAACVSCGRCFWYCPQDQVHRLQTTKDTKNTKTAC